MHSWLCFIELSCARWFHSVWLLLHWLLYSIMDCDPATCATGPALFWIPQKKSQGIDPIQTAFVFLCLSYSHANATFHNHFGQWLDWTVQEETGRSHYVLTHRHLVLFIVYYWSAPSGCILQVSHGRLRSGSLQVGAWKLLVDICARGVFNSFLYVTAHSLV